MRIKHKMTGRGALPKIFLIFLGIFTIGDFYYTVLANKKLYKVTNSRDWYNMLSNYTDYFIKINYNSYYFLREYLG